MRHQVFLSAALTVAVTLGTNAGLASLLSQNATTDSTKPLDPMMMERPIMNTDRPLLRDPAQNSPMFQQQMWQMRTPPMQNDTMRNAAVADMKQRMQEDMKRKLEMMQKQGSATSTATSDAMQQRMEEELMRKMEMLQKQNGSTFEKQNMDAGIKTLMEIMKTVPMKNDGTVDTAAVQRIKEETLKKMEMMQDQNDSMGMQMPEKMNTNVVQMHNSGDDISRKIEMLQPSVENCSEAL